MLNRIQDRLQVFASGLRRVLLALLVFILVAVLTLVLLAPDSIAEVITNVSIFIRLLLVVLMYALATFFFYREFLAEDRNLKGLIVRSSGGTKTSVSAESAQERIRENIIQLDDVQSVDVVVEGVRGKAKIALDVDVYDWVSLPKKQNEITRKLDQVVEKQMGLRMSERPAVQVRFVDGSQKPTPSETTSPPEDKPEEVPPPPVDHVDEPESEASAPPRLGRFRRERKEQPAVTDESTETPDTIEETQPAVTDESIETPDTIEETQPESQPLTSPTDEEQPLTDTADEKPEPAIPEPDDADADEKPAADDEVPGPLAQEAEDEDDDETDFWSMLRDSQDSDDTKNDDEKNQ